MGKGLCVDCGDRPCSPHRAKVCDRCYSRQWAAANPDRVLAKRRGLTPEQIERGRQASRRAKQRRREAARLAAASAPPPAGLAITAKVGPAMAFYRHGNLPRRIVWVLETRMFQCARCDRLFCAVASRRRRRFCSATCRNPTRRVKLSACVECGTDVSNRRAGTKYCRPCGQRVRRRPEIDPDWRASLLKDPCVYCGGVANAVDHIHPVARGGSHGWGNLAPACGSCNRSKGDTALLSFLLRRAGRATARNGRMEVEVRMDGGSAVRPRVDGPGHAAGPRTNCQAHCTACGGHFTSLGAFDAHRRGKPGARYCNVDVAVEGRPLLVVKTENGSCDLARPVVVSGATVWAGRDWWKAGKAFRR